MAPEAADVTNTYLSEATICVGFAGTEKLPTGLPLAASIIIVVAFPEQSRKTCSSDGSFASAVGR
ncbi:MAG TPA: hypothetical protein PLK80_16440, partial [bacterium]|nr:hypothetical protein [bacterium]